MSEKRAGRYHHNGDFDLQKTLDIAGFSQAELARRLNVHPNTVSKWMTGKTDVPGPVVAYLRLWIGINGVLR